MSQPHAITLTNNNEHDSQFTTWLEGDVLSNLPHSTLIGEGVILEV